MCVENQYVDKVIYGNFRSVWSKYLTKVRFDLYIIKPKCQLNSSENPNVYTSVSLGTTPKVSEWVLVWMDITPDE